MQDRRIQSAVVAGLALLLGSVVIFHKFGGPKPLPDAQIFIEGSTNKNGVTCLVIRIPPILSRGLTVPFGHKAFHTIELGLECQLVSGGNTNLLFQERIDPLHWDQKIDLAIPPNVKSLKITTAVGHVGSFQDLELPLGFSFPRLKESYNYMAGSVFSVAE